LAIIPESSNLVVHLILAAITFLLLALGVLLVGVHYVSGAIRLRRPLGRSSGNFQFDKVVDRRF
jgi:hypothetical protein